MGHERAEQKPARVIINYLAGIDARCHADFCSSKQQQQQQVAQAV